MNLLTKIKEARERLSGFWAIEEKSYVDILKIYENFEKNPKSFVQDVNAIDDLFSVNPDEILFINQESGEATIKINGPLVDVHDCATVFFGCTSYEDIRSAIQSVEEMDEINKVIFDIDSPGGMVSGCDNAAIAINGMKKTTEARVGSMAASAAYWLASQCDSITATSATASFGSIGVVVEYWDGSRSMNEKGFDKVCITSSGAPDKRKDALTDEGRRKIKSDLDEIEKIFFRRVASGRNVTVSDVGAKFGQGGMFLAEKSLNAGMIDKTDFILNNNINSKNNQKDKETVETKMNLKEYVSKHPEAQKEIDALVNEAVKAVEAKHETASKEASERINKASTFLSADYEQDVKDLAIDCIKGEQSVEALEAVVAHVDKTREAKKSEDAINDSEGVEETAPQKVSDNKENDGAITDEESYQSALSRIKNLK